MLRPRHDRDQSRPVNSLFQAGWSFWGVRSFRAPVVVPPLAPWFRHSCRGSAPSFGVMHDHHPVMHDHDPVMHDGTRQIAGFCGVSRPNGATTRAEQGTTRAEQRNHAGRTAEPCRQNCGTTQAELRNHSGRARARSVEGGKTGTTPRERQAQRAEESGAARGRFVTSVHEAFRTGPRVR